VIYQAVLDANIGMFEGLVEGLSDALVRDEIELVIGDAAEQQIMVHDLWRDMRFSAIERAERRLGRKIDHREFPLETDPLRWSRPRRNDAHVLQLAESGASDPSGGRNSSTKFAN
tara:strand:- start:115 stop:459 length:345 start_codon:yes stop_codon:yes gene_type:complete